MIQDFICVIVLLAIPGLPILAILLSMLMAKVTGEEPGRTNSFGPCGTGPRCDICGQPLRRHGMYGCETYC